MHELSIADAILETVRGEASRRAGARIVTVGVRVGELSGVNPDALRFSFEALVAGTELDPLSLEIELCPRRERCEECGETFEPAGLALSCPKCGGHDTRCISGQELEVAYLEIAESEPESVWEAEPARQERGIHE